MRNGSRKRRRRRRKNKQTPRRSVWYDIYPYYTLRPEALGCYQCRVEDFVVGFKTDGGSEPEPEPEPGGGDNDDGDGNGGDDDEGEGGGGGGEGNPNEFDDCIVTPGRDPGDDGC